MTPSLRTALACALLAAMSMTAPARADPLKEAVAALSNEIEEVRMVGEWERDGLSGVYRIVIARTGAQTIHGRVFVQWIAFTEGGASTRATLEIDEIRELGMDVRETSVGTDTDRLVLTFELAGSDPAKDGTYEAIIKAPDDYKFQKAGN